MPTGRLFDPSCQILRDFGQCPTCRNKSLQVGNVGRVEQIRRLRYLVNAGQITIREAISWFLQG